MVKTYENKSVGVFVSGFDPTSTEYNEKHKLRVKRFGEQTDVVTQESISKLYDSLNIDQSRATECGVRLNAVHVRGVDHFSTQRVFDFFAEFAPTAIEWINDSSCNVVWADDISAARAMIKLSRPAQQQQQQQHDTADAATPGVGPDTGKPAAAAAGDDIEMMEEDDELNLLSEDDVAKLERKTVTADEHQAMLVQLQTTVGNTTSTVGNTAPIVTDDTDSKQQQQEELATVHPVVVVVPDGYWRVGRPSRRAKCLLMRFADKDDKKLPGAGRHSEYYRKYGNPSFGGLKGLISGSKRRQMYSKQNDIWHIDQEQQQEEECEQEDLRQLVKRRRTTTTTTVEQQQQQQQDSSSSSSDDNVACELTANQLARLNEPKHRMKLYSDTVDTRPATHRLGRRVDTSVFSRLSPVTVAMATVATTTDLRSRLDRKRKVDQLTIELDVSD